MELRVLGGRLEVVSSSDSELRWFKNKLTFTSEWGKKVNVLKLFFQKDDGTFFTFSGLVSPLKACSPFPFEVRGGESLDFSYAPKISNEIFENFRLFDFQVGAARKAIISKKGIIQLPTGSGKSEVLLTILRTLFSDKKIEKALVLVPSVALAEQLFERGLKRGFTKEEIGVVHGSKKNYRPITIGVSNSIHRGFESGSGDAYELVKSADALLMDECHHGRSDTWMKILTAAKAEYLVGFSATPFQNSDVFKDAGDALVHGVMGAPIFTISHSYLRSLVLPDGTVGLTALPVIHFAKTSGTMSTRNYGWHKVYNENVVKNHERNQKIKHYINLFQKFGFPTLVLLQRKEHAETLMREIGDPKSITVFGNQKGLQFDEFGQLHQVSLDYAQFAEDFENGAYNLCFASQVFDEGVDLPAIGAVINAGAGRSRIKLNQRTGRGLRAKRGQPNKVYVVDFWDRSHVFLSAQSKARKRMYEEIEAEISFDENRLWLQLHEHSKFLGA